MLYLAVYEGQERTRIHVCFLDPPTQTIAKRSFIISERPFEETERIAAGHLELEGGLKEIAEFLASFNIQSRPNVVIAANHKIMQTDAPIITVFASLCAIKLCPFIIATDPDKKFAIFGQQIPPQMEPNRSIIKTASEFVYTGLIKAYANFLFGVDSGELGAACVTALVASERPLFNYLSGAGEVQSSGDMINYLRRSELKAKLNIPQHVEIDNSGVGSGMYSYKLSESSCFDPSKIDKVGLAYAAGAQKYNFLAEQSLKTDPLKFGLLSACRRVGLRIHCASVYDGLLARKLLDGDKDDVPEEQREVRKKFREQLTRGMADGYDPTDILVNILQGLEGKTNVEAILLALGWVSGPVPVAFDPANEVALWFREAALSDR
jgi:hypothetical protein